MVVGSAGWYLASPLFVNNVVDEEFPAPSPDRQEPAQASEAGASEAAAEMPDKKMDDPMPAAVSDAPAIAVQGQFKDADSFHKGAGTATIYQLPDGSHVLRFENFETTNGPDLHVLLSKHPAPASQDEVMDGYIDLGSLKGNIGNQNYDIPAGTDISEYKSIVIYCMPFHVVFSTATLS
jgi:hypothetical protein